MNSETSSRLKWRRWRWLVILMLFSLLCFARGFAQETETLRPLKDGAKAPSNFDEMWAGFDPRKEPLEVEILKEWEEDETVLKVVRFRIGIFKGKRAKLAGIYGFPKNLAAHSNRNHTKLPGLLQIHGGGQYADHKACIANARRGYATLSIAWAGRLSASKYRVDPNRVKLFWEQNTDDPNYHETTDWGALDGYHAPSRYKQTVFPSAAPNDQTIDKIESPRNSPWFICALAARRGLTFLEQQAEVDPERLGVYGHSMGGKLTVMTSVDPRVKACAPSCGGISDRDNRSELFQKTIGDDVSLRKVSCPIIFLSPANDFHGRIGDLPTAVKEIASKNWRVTCSAHLNHVDRPENEVTTLLWFDQHLKGSFAFPETPQTKLTLNPGDGIPELQIEVDPRTPYREIDVYYTQQGLADENGTNRENTMNRYWQHGVVQKTGKQLTAKLTDVDPGKPLWVFANVIYPLELPVSGAGYYYGPYTADSYNVSSILEMVTPTELQTAGVNLTSRPAQAIENFEAGWEKNWYTTSPGDWRLSTHKIYAPQFAGPEGSQLAVRVLSQNPNQLLILLDDYAAKVSLVGDGQWQDVILDLGDFKNFDGQSPTSWIGLKTLQLNDVTRLRGKQRKQNRVVGKKWTGPPPQFQNLHWRPAVPTK